MGKPPIQSNDAKSRVITLEPVTIDVAMLPEPPKTDTKVPSADDTKEMLKALESSQKKLAEELKALLDDQGNLKKDKVEEVKGKVVKKLQEIQKGDGTKEFK